MKKLNQTLILLLLAVISTGCASSYMIDRQRDAADIFTVSYGYGFGAKGGIGPLSVGLLAIDHDWDVKEICKQATDQSTGDLAGAMVLSCMIASAEYFGEIPKQDPISKKRGKYYEADDVCFLNWTRRRAEENLHWNAGIPYYTRVELVASLVGSIRLGFNPGELLDFFIGWSTIDLFSDDIGIIKRKEPPAKIAKQAVPVKSVTPVKAEKRWHRIHHESCESVEAFWGVGE